VTHTFPAHGLCDLHSHGLTTTICHRMVTELQHLRGGGAAARSGAGLSPTLTSHPSDGPLEAEKRKRSRRCRRRGSTVVSESSRLIRSIFVSEGSTQARCLCSEDLR
jgi:hypothetical protein